MRCCWGKVLVTQPSVGVGGAVLQIEQLARRGDYDYVMDSVEGN